MRTLKTYIQISDLHFVNLLQSFAFDKWASHVPFLAGFVGSHVPALRYLRRYFSTLAASTPDLDLIVTGDLTACGARSEFHDADRYLAQAGKHPDYLGLSQKDWVDRSIPGNHDFWPGLPFQPVGFANLTVLGLFPEDASVSHAFTTTAGQDVVFLHLNGDADVGPFSPERVFACGSFVSAVRRLETLMVGRPAGEIRILLLHHAIHYAGSPVQFGGSRWVPLAVTGKLKHLTIDDASKNALVRFLVDHDVRVVLTGHLHHPHFIGSISHLVPGAGHDIMESCCGTTTQRPLVGSGPTPPNSLVEHRLEEDDVGGLHWRSEVKTLSLSGTAAFGAPVPPIPLNSSHSVPL